jgi:glycosyltransferase involved in cell wall biosynthesis
MIIGIDASNIKNSGGLKHLVEFLSHVQLEKFSIEKIIILGGNQLDDLPNHIWLEKRKEPLLMSNSFWKESFWKIFKSEKIFLSSCNIVFAPGGTFFSKKIPYISMSQNMLVFEDVEARRFGFSWVRLRLYILRILQAKSLKNAAGVIFISKYAKTYITSLLKLKKQETKVIYFGSSTEFRKPVKDQTLINQYNKKIKYKILYVSVLDHYKHQDKLVKSIESLIKKDYPIELTLVGPTDTKYFKKFQKILFEIENHSEFIKCLGSVNYRDISKLYSEADLFVFPSSCENMPNILIEAMSSGLPIASSNYGSMPEFLKDAGEYFDPLNIGDMANAIEKLILNPDLRHHNALKAQNYTEQLSWEKCANETLEFISNCYQNYTLGTRNK